MSAIGQPERAGAPDPALPVVTTAAPERGWRPSGSWIKQLPFILLLLGFSVLFVYPFLWLLSSSLKPRAYVFSNRLIPEVWHWYNYVQIWHAAPFLRWFGNSLYIDFAAAISVTFASALTAFAFAYFRFPLRNFLFGCVLATMMLPSAVTMIPVYLIWHHMSLENSQFPLWAPNLFEFKAKWTDLMTPLIYLHSDNQFTIPRGLYALLGQFAPSAGGQGDYQLIMAALVLSTLPMLIIFAFGQRYFIEGITLQGRKG